MHIFNIGDQIHKIDNSGTRMALDKYIGTTNANKPILGFFFSFPGDLCTIVLILFVLSVVTTILIELCYIFSLVSLSVIYHIDDDVILDEKKRV